MPKNIKPIPIVLSILFFVVLSLAMKKPNKEMHEALVAMLDKENDFSHSRLRLDGIYLYATDRKGCIFRYDTLEKSNIITDQYSELILTMCFYKNGVCLESATSLNGNSLDTTNIIKLLKIRGMPRWRRRWMGAFEAHNDTLSIIAYASFGRELRLAYYRAILKGTDTIEYKLMPPYVNKRGVYCEDTATRIYVFMPFAPKTFFDSVKGKKIMYKLPRLLKYQGPL